VAKPKKRKGKQYLIYFMKTKISLQCKMVQWLCTNNTGSKCVTTRLVKSVQATPIRKANGQSKYASKQSYLEKVRKSCNTENKSSNPQYAMDGAVASSHRLHALRNNILNRETRRDFNGKLI
jgi:hypothetical protein